MTKQFQSGPAFPFIKRKRRDLLRPKAIAKQNQEVEEQALALAKQEGRNEAQTEISATEGSGVQAEAAGTQQEPVEVQHGAGVQPVADSPEQRVAVAEDKPDVANLNRGRRFGSRKRE